MERHPRVEDRRWGEFRRQHALGRFILDFHCHTARLCVEVDGGIHDLQPERDAERDACLAAAGIKTLRFRNEEVLGDTRAVLRRIEQEVWHRTAP